MIRLGTPLHFCWPWIAEERTTFLPKREARRRHRNAGAVGKEISGLHGAQAAQSRNNSTERRSASFRGSLELFRDWQRTQTQSSEKALRGRRQQMDVRFCEQAGTTAERHTLRAAGSEYVGFCALLRSARQEISVFS